MDNFSNWNHSWNEFQWEQEIRKDDRRISEYLRELVSCIDLPDEDELIFDQLAASPDLVPSSGSSDSLREWMFHSESDENDECFDEVDPTHRHREQNCRRMLDEVDSLTAEWNILAAGTVRSDLRDQALAISCVFAKLLARTGDLTEPVKDAPEQLLISHGKRALQELNQLAGRLKKMSILQPSAAPDILDLLTRLAEFREQLISALETLRKISK